MILRLLQPSRFNGDVHFLLFLTGRTLFLGKFNPKKTIFCWSWDLEPRIIQICRIWWWILINLFQKFKVLILSWNLVPELLGICKVWWWCSFFCFELLSASFIREICWHFDVIWLISQQFTPRDMKPMAFLVLSCKAVLHAETWSQWLFLFYHVKLFYTLLFIFFILSHWLHHYLYIYFLFCFSFEVNDHPIFTHLTYIDRYCESSYNSEMYNG